MKRSELYKSFQLYDFFVNRYSYTSFRLMGGLSQEGELWLVSKDDPNYQVIRISNRSTESAIDESEKINTIIDVCKQRFYLKNVRFLDIHVCQDEVYEEKYDTSCIEIGFHSGIDLNEIYPGVYDVIHETVDEENEIKRLLDSINSRIRELKLKERKRPIFYKFLHNPIAVTVNLIAVCTFMYLLTIRYSSRYSDTATLVYLGADYKMFTLGLGQYWRLLTCGLLHSSLLHLFTNMFSLLIIGAIIEPRVGHLKFLAIIVFGTLTASLTHGVMSGNSLVVGLSGGIYAIFAYFIFYYLENKLIDIRSLMPTIVLNLCLNFLPNVSWQAHLGGAVCGILFYYIYKNDRVNYAIAPVILLLIGGLFFKYYRDAYIKPYYGGTDMEVVQMIRDSGRKEYADHIESELYKIYMSD